MHSKRTGDLQKSLMYQHCEVISISFVFSRNLDCTISSWQLVKFATVDCGLMNTSMKRSYNGFMKRFAATNNLITSVTPVPKTPQKFMP